MGDVQSTGSSSSPTSGHRFKATWVDKDTIIDRLFGREFFYET
jgi:hypothetical protein